MLFLRESPKKRKVSTPFSLPPTVKFLEYHSFTPSIAFRYWNVPSRLKWYLQFRLNKYNFEKRRGHRSGSRCRGMGFLPSVWCEAIICLWKEKREPLFALKKKRRADFYTFILPRRPTSSIIQRNEGRSRPIRRRAHQSKGTNGADGKPFASTAIIDKDQSVWLDRERWNKCRNLYALFKDPFTLSNFKL